MAQESINEIADLKDERDVLKKEFKALKEHYDSEYIRIGRKITQIESKLRKICKHDWIRDNYIYADLYCKHCLIGKR